MFIHWVLVRNIQYVNLVLFECVLMCSKLMMRKVHRNYAWFKIKSIFVVELEPKHYIIKKNHI